MISVPFSLQITVSLDARLLLTPDKGSNERNARGLKLCWMSQELDWHVHDSRMYGMGRSAEPRIVCPKPSLRSMLTFMRLIPGMRLLDASPTIDTAYGDVAI